MPRSPRVFVEGGIYHVFNRVTRGEKVFAEDSAAQHFLDVLQETKQRDEFIVLAWCIMPNHYHLAVRCVSVPLWRSLASIQAKVTRKYNARLHVHGPFWQGRYQAKLVEDPRYLRQLLLYIHLNPVSAGIVERPGDYLWSGHRDAIRNTRTPFVDADQLLLVFGETRRDARKTYLASIRATKEAPWAGAEPGGLPWWRLGRPPTVVKDTDLSMQDSIPFIDELGRSTAIERPLLKADDFIEWVLGELAIEIEDVIGRSKRREVVRSREILMTLGVERFGLRVTDLAASLGVRYDTASLWGRRGAHRRISDDRFRRRIDEIDGSLATTPSSVQRDQS